MVVDGVVAAHYTAVLENLFAAASQAMKCALVK